MENEKVILQPGMDLPKSEPSVNVDDYDFGPVSVQPGLENYTSSIDTKELVDEYKSNDDEEAEILADMESEDVESIDETPVEEEDTEIAEESIDEEPEEVADETEAAPVDEVSVEKEIVEEKIDNPAINIETVKVKQEEESVVEEDELEVESVDEDENHTFEVLKKMITEKIKPVSTRLDLTGFTVSNKPSNSNNIFETDDVAATKWVLPTTGVTVLMKEFKGSDMERLRMLMQGNNARGTLQMIYENIVSPKPSFNKWLNTIAFDDYDHLFMAIYVASFGESNYMPIDCNNKDCTEKSYITDHVPFKDLINYPNDAAKEKFMALYREEPVEAKGFKATEIVPITDKWAVGFVTPSLYSIMIEPNYFDGAFREKYTTAISIAPYIDSFYMIDQINKTLIPIDYTRYDNNDSKTAKSKVIKYNKILSTLNSDEISVLRACIEAINEDNESITYKQPETTCPHCGHINPEITDGITAATMLFLRNQLALLVRTT